MTPVGTDKGHADGANAGLLALTKTMIMGLEGRCLGSIESTVSVHLIELGYTMCFVLCYALGMPCDTHGGLSTMFVLIVILINHGLSAL